MHTYDPARYIVTFAGVPIMGFMSGTYVSIEQDVDTWTDDVGASGETTRVRSRNTNATATITLQQASPSNDALSALHLEDKRTGQRSGQFMLKALDGATVVLAADAYIIRTPTIEQSDENTGREWQIKLVSPEVFVGGF